MIDSQPAEVIEDQIFHEQKWWAYANPLDGTYLTVVNFLAIFDHEDTGRLMETIAIRALSQGVGHYISTSEISEIIQTQNMNGLILIEREELNDLKTLYQRLKRFCQH